MPLRRHEATALDIAASAAMVLYILFVDDFTTVLHDFVALLVVWLAPFGAVWIVDGLMRRWRYEPAEIHDPRPPSGAHWRRRGFNIAQAAHALLVGVVPGPPDGQRADPARAGERRPGRRGPDVDAEPARQRGDVLGARPAPGLLEQPELRGAGTVARAGLDVELAVDQPHVALDGVARDVELLADLRPSRDRCAGAAAPPSPAVESSSGSASAGESGPHGARPRSRRSASSTRRASTPGLGVSRNPAWRMRRVSRGGVEEHRPWPATGASAASAYTCSGLAASTGARTTAHSSR